MIFRLKTSKRTQEIFEELENRTNYTSKYIQSLLWRNKGTICP